jgi:rhamnosyltransferase subunit B
MRVVFSCFGSPGDVYPFLGMAKGYLLQGHDAHVIGPTHGAAPAAQMGVPYEPLWGDLPQYNRPEFWADWRSFLVWPHMALMLTHGLHAQLQRHDNADLYVSHQATPGLGAFADRIGAPWAMAALSPLQFMSKYDPPVLGRSMIRPGPMLHRARVGVLRAATAPLAALVRSLRAGLPDRGHPLYEGQWSPHENWALFDESFAARQPDWPTNTVFKGFPRPRVGAVPPGLLEFLRYGAQPMVFTLGSTPLGGADFWGESIAAAQALGLRAVLMTSRSVPAAPNVLTVANCPLSAVFPYASVIVHHGGAGTMAEALAAKRPQIVVPFVNDQFDNAARLARATHARILPSHRYTSANLVKALS